jgi:hypothetical protein
MTDYSDKFRKENVNLLVFIKQVYHDARSTECETARHIPAKKFSK